MTKSMEDVCDTKHDTTADIVNRMMRRFRPAGLECLEPTIEGTLICHLDLLQSVIMRRANSNLVIEGLTFQQWLALGAIAHHAEKGIRHSELGALLRLSKAPVTGMVDRLERAGWVMRKPDSEDRRAARILVTEKGVQVWQKAHHVMRRSSAALFDRLSKEEKCQLLSILRHLLDDVTATGVIPELTERCLSGDCNGE